jgi:CBS domain-containing protein/gamma-glutamyl:cysteine ligase YbdK (ATP-grasp superfamily)
MSDRPVRPELQPEAIRAFTKEVLRDLRALERMLLEGVIEEGVRRFGAEQELFLVDRTWRPAPIGLEVLERLKGGPFTSELALFNLEINLTPLRLEGRALSRLEEEIERLLGQVRTAAREQGGEVILTGTLPTLAKSDLTLDQITPKERYFILNEALTTLRGGDYELRIEGADELILHHDSVMLEACNTSCQVHLQVGATEFVPVYNAAQFVLPLVLAACGNSPLLFGRRLWAETRIALFQQSLDTRSTTDYVRDLPPRARFGDRWLEGSVTTLFQDDLARFRVLMSGPVDEDPISLLDAGKAPRLQALQLFNSTIYRWNRPCYGISEGKPHLRIECRVLPAGPSVLDEVANAALWLGAVLGVAARYGDPAGRMEFAKVKSNFLAAARHGLHAGLHWIDGRTLDAPTLILDFLLPLAREGLDLSGVDPAESERYLEVIQERVRSGQTGSEWALRSLEGMGEAGILSERMAALVAGTVQRQEEGRPGHEWSLAEIEEGGGWTRSHLRVEQYMTTDPVTVSEDELVDLVAFVMDRERIRHIPVEDREHRLVGIVSYRSLLRFMVDRPGDGSEGAPPVKDVMERNPVTVGPDTLTLDAIELMRDRGVACLPVVRDGKLIGMVTERHFMPIAYELMAERLKRDE